MYETEGDTDAHGENSTEPKFKAIAPPSSLMPTAMHELLAKAENCLKAPTEGDVTSASEKKQRKPAEKTIEEVQAVCLRKAIFERLEVHQKTTKEVLDAVSVDIGCGKCASTENGCRYCLHRALIEVNIRRKKTMHGE